MMQHDTISCVGDINNYLMNCVITLIWEVWPYTKSGGVLVKKSDAPTVSNY